MKRFKCCLLPIFLGLFLVACGSLYETDFLNKKTPFEKIKWNGNTPVVTFIGHDTWYEVLSIEDVPIDKIIQGNKSSYGTYWKRRFYEDMGMTLANQNVYLIADKLLVTIKDVKTNEIIKTEVPYYGKGKVDALTQWVKEHEIRKNARAHYDTILPQYEHLTRRIFGYPTKAQLKKAEDKIKTFSEEELFLIASGYKESPVEWISKKRAYKTLDETEVALKKHFAYLELRGVDYQYALDAIRKKIGIGIARNDLAMQLKKFMVLFGDAHSRVSSGHMRIKKADKVRFPFYCRGIGGKVVVVKKKDKNNSHAFLPELYNNVYPFLESIDGFSTKYLIARAKEYYAHASEGLEKSLPEYIGSLYSILRLEAIERGNLVPSDSIQVVLSNEQGAPQRFKMPLFSEKITQKQTPKKEKLSKEERELEDLAYKITDENIGYLRIKRMRKRGLFVGELKKAMESFRNTKGIIIDVRHNPGGNRIPTLTLLPYFITQPRVINVATLRIDKDLDPGDLYNESYDSLILRYLYPQKSKEWNAQERTAIDTWLATHKPNWNYDTDKFSKLHFCVVSPKQEASYYKNPVMILMDEGCYSAADIFLGAFKGVKNVQLVGVPSGGGSGFARSHNLLSSLLKLKASRMASFKNNGDLYEGNGVLPDVLVDLNVEDLKNGIDTQYTRAVALIKKMQ